ncbi:MAG: helix-turn-helix transcriptional regulator [Clostridia bacterium]|nr:helix-turn-helix transcriptional regulator [Clostridia bacterium]MBR0538056.1 helix-turn-helix transcriptional regulator [Clostridia bacterium]
MRTRKETPGTKNLIGRNIYRRRIELGIKQKDLLARLQTRGVDLCISSLSKIEGQTRFVSDIELKAIADALQMTADELLHE